MKTMRERFDDKFQVSTGKNHNDTSKECFPCEGGYCQMSPAEIKDFIEQELKLKDQEHKAELEMIKGEIEKLGNIIVNDKITPMNEKCVKLLLLEDIHTILDSHINKLSTE